MQRTIILCLVTLAVAIDIAAQPPPPDYKGPVNTAGIAGGDGKQIKGGVLNGKAESLPKPAYPAAALAVGASGAVSVQVLIDENGDVLSAEAVSGHPLLRAAAAQAARGAKFSPTLLSGHPVKVSGIIVYNFAGPLYPIRLGFVLSHAERTASFRNNSTPASLASDLPASWIPERDILNSLTFEERPTPSDSAAEKQSRLTRVKVDPASTADNNRYTVNFAAVGGPSGNHLGAKSVGSLQNLIGLVDARYSASEPTRWAYELGISLGAFVAEVDDEVKFASNIAKLEELVERVPSGIRTSSLQYVRDFIAASKIARVTDETRLEIISKAELLTNLRY